MDTLLEDDINNPTEKNNNIYEMIFNIVTNITLDSNKNEIKLKQYKIIEKIIANIIETENNNENNEKVRRIKVNNPNIDLILKIKGVYDFLTFLGFKEDYYENELTLYLPKDNIEISKLDKALYYMNFLHLNFIDINSNDNLNYFETPSRYLNSTSFCMESKKSEDIKTKDQPISQINNNAEAILKETGKERYERALNYSHNDNSCLSFSNILNFFTCGQYNKSSDEDNRKFFEEKAKENNKKKNVMTLHDLQYKNPDNEIECKDEIGKKCLLLTNKFREKNHMPPLTWDNSIWKIAYIHSKNMGDGKVPFSHKGFNERVEQFNFTCYRACENVYMCQGYSQYNIAENAVQGWINSPGHRKNLLSDTSHVAIATYMNRYGEFYLTQLFALK